jgi:hypothetical protein
MTTTPTSTTNAAARAPTTPTIIYSNNARFPLGQIVATPGLWSCFKKPASAPQP